MRISRPLQYVLLASVCATLYFAWLDPANETSAPVARRLPSITDERPPPALPDPAQGPGEDLRTVDLFAAPAWRFGVAAASADGPDGDDAPASAKEPDLPALELSAVWRDARGVMVVLTLGQATRVACDGCVVPGHLKPGDHWNGYRLDALSPSGITVTHLSTGRRLRLDAN